jgi:2-amino-4-hydroxy-6-hydroxymethyldihydropteridine diphosphokinase
VKSRPDKSENAPGETIYIAFGANLPSARAGSPRATLDAALADLQQAGFHLTARSRWYRTAPIPASDQPDFVNGVAAGHWDLPPQEVLARLHAVERSFGRERGVLNAARVLDLDLLAYGGRVSDGSDGGPVLPHPRMASRAFVLLPLAEIAPDWRHPQTGEPIRRLLAALPAEQRAAPLAE